MPGLNARGFDSFIFRVEIKCTCEGDVPRIGYAEYLMSKELGLDIHLVHAWADVSEDFLDRAIDTTEYADEYIEKYGGWRASY